jgi:small subunit ribosomal protein S1
MRAFCPFSQMGIRRDENQAEYIGRSLLFNIAEYAEGGRNIVLTRRAILDQEKREKKQVLKQTLKEGEKIRGKVTSIQKFGAFVDIGGVEGLLPISEIAWTRTEKVEGLLSVGQEVEVIIKKLDWEHDRISFSLKDALQDPWDLVVDTFLVGSYHTGVVSRIAAFGAFVTLKDGVDGLIHISKMGAGRRINHPREVLKDGQSVEVQVEAVDRALRRISLALAEVRRAEEEEAATMKDYHQKATEEPQNMGTLGDVLKTKLEQKDK